MKIYRIVKREYDRDDIPFEYIVQVGLGMDFWLNSGLFLTIEEAEERVDKLKKENDYQETVVKIYE